MTVISKFGSLIAVSALAFGAGTQSVEAQSLLEKTNPYNVTLQGISSATVAPQGMVFGSLSGTTKRSGAVGTDLDGSLSFGLGFGSAEDTIGVQVTGNITSLTDDFGDSGYFDLKLSRRIKKGPNPTYLSLTFGRIGPWGDARGRLVTVPSPTAPETGESPRGEGEGCLECDGKPPAATTTRRVGGSNKITGTVALTQFAQMSFGDRGKSYPVMFTLGAGTNIRNNQTDPGIFFGAGIGLSESLGVSAAWGGDYLNIGASLRLKQFKNASLSATVYDVLDTKNSRRLTLSVNFFTRDLFKGASF